MFQLNLAIWLVTPAPDGASTRPVLGEAGYFLSAVSPRLPLPPAIRPALAKVAGVEPPSPDVLLGHNVDPTFLVLECKASSFGPDSSTARQARKLLAIGGDLSEPLGLPVGSSRPGHVVYLTGRSGQGPLVETLAGLTSQLGALGLAAASGSVIGLERRDDGVYIDLAPAGPPEPLGVALANPVRVLAVPRADDPRPLYLIPWDPSVEQDKDEADWCRALLASRVLTEAISALGRMAVPGPLSLVMRDLLRAATFDVAIHWRAKDDVAKVERLIRETIAKALKSLASEVSLTAGAPSDLLQLVIQTEETRQSAIAALQAVDPFAALIPSPPDQPTLFDPPEGEELPAGQEGS